FSQVYSLFSIDAHNVFYIFIFSDEVPFHLHYSRLSPDWHRSVHLRRVRSGMAFEHPRRSLVCSLLRGLLVKSLREDARPECLRVRV
ncbi:hypothetical protein PMAYCL1PPCAC_19762, partial [Pristionchus mayeri]